MLFLSITLVLLLSFGLTGVAFATHLVITAEDTASDGEDDGFGGTFTTLKGAYGVTTFTVDDILYAIVASSFDDGVQIINLSDPENITAEDTASDGEDDGFGGTFTELKEATNVATFTNSTGFPFAIVASYTDSGVQIIDLSDPSNIKAKDAASDGESDGASGTFTTLGGALDVATFTVSGDPYAIVTAYDDNGVQIIDLSDPENIRAEDSARDNESDGDGGTFTNLIKTQDVATFTVSNVPYAIVVSEDVTNGGVQIINLSDPENITAEDAASDGESDGFGGTFTKLKGAVSVTTFTVDNIVYAMVGSVDDHGVQIINLSDPENITAKDTAGDGENDGFGGTFTTLLKGHTSGFFTVDSVFYAIVVSAQDNGAQIINLSDLSNITAAGAITNGVDGFSLQDPYDLEVFTVNGNPYAITANRNGDGVQIISFSIHGSSTSDSGSCGDCIDPTFYYSQNRFIVQDGFRYNDYSTDLNATHTKISPLITNTNDTNFLTLKVYDNSGPNAINWIDVAFGSPGFYHSFDASDVTIQIEFSHGIMVESYIVDKQSLITFGDITTSVVDCGYMDENCLQITIPHTFTGNNTSGAIVVMAVDESKNKKYHYIDVEEK